MPLLFASVTAGTSTGFTSSVRVCKDALVLPSASFAPSGKPFTAASAAALVSATFAFNAVSLSASAWLMMPSLFASANASSAAFSAASAAFTFSNASATAFSLLFLTSLLPALLLALVSSFLTAGTVIPSRTLTRACNLAGVLPSASFASVGRAFTAASAASFISAALAFNALRASASAWLITPSALASANAFSAAFSASSAAFTRRRASSIGDLDEDDSEVLDEPP